MTATLPIRPLRILQTPPRYAPYTGGVEAVSRAIASECADAGDEVAVVCADEPSGAPRLIDGIPVVRLRWPFKVANTNITPMLPFVLATRRWDVVHTHLPTPWSADWSCLIARLLGRRAILTFHNDISGNGLGGLVAVAYRHTLERLTLRLAHGVVVLSPPWRDYLINRHPTLTSKIVCIPNGVDVHQFSPPATDAARTEDLLFVGILDRFHGFKGLDALLQAMQLVPRARLRIAGGGELRASYERQCTKWGLDQRVHFLGSLCTEELANEYRTAGIFVQPSHAGTQEGMPLAVLEALASGLPVIVSEGVGGLAKEVAGANAGVIVPSGDPRALAEAIEAMLGRPAMRSAMGAAGRDLAVEAHSWRVIADRIRQLYLARPRSDDTASAPEDGES